MKEEKLGVDSIICSMSIYDKMLKVISEEIGVKLYGTCGRKLKNKTNFSLNFIFILLC